MSPVGAEILIHEIIREGIVARWHRRVRGEQRIRGHRLPCLVKAQAARDQFAAAFQAQEGSVPFVDMPGGGCNAQRAQRPHTANAQHDLLRNTHLAVPTVQARGKFPVIRRIRGNVRIHQVQ